MRTIKLENGNKVEIFERDDLIEKLGLTEEETMLVLKYQLEFPELLQKRKKKDFVIEGRNFWEKLNEPQGDFSNWINRKLIKFFKLNEDYSKHHNSVEVGNLKRPQLDYKLTVETAKHVALSELTVIEREIQKYFIIMEEALRNIINWLSVRGNQINNYNAMRDTLETNFFVINHMTNPPDKWYQDEANMLNVALTSKTARKLREHFNTTDIETREHLETEVNEALNYLQERNIMMLEMENSHTLEVGFEKRKEMIEKICKDKYPHIMEKFQKIEESVEV